MDFKKINKVCNFLLTKYVMLEENTEYKFRVKKKLKQSTNRNAKFIFIHI